MKFIIVGLGNFGASLAQKLTQQGNEVIGIDSSMAKVTALKDKISHTICMNAIDEQTVCDLPLKNTDIVIVCIGEDQGTNVLVSALFKNLGVKRLISRSINALHENILRAIGVDDIVRPEEESAERWTKKLTLKGVVDSFELNKNYSIVEIRTPKAFIGKTIEEIGLRENFNIVILTILNQSEETSFLGKTKTLTHVQGVPNPKIKLSKEDILVVYGSNSDLYRFMK
ncbi:potassium transporter TrkA [Capnocytophaga canimorsus]|uniref:Potassium transporter TrkA n=1 Tax=Capnocytophaga canimorsus TaxID=28188 RepID=A0A250G2S2_9FLAO|nr:TrkA family potassium uptake protein [Capnocytophaga canimorsus]ATA91709.1 potassium transporter TrkA [Capnocytophaga canimorsus]